MERCSQRLIFACVRRFLFALLCFYRELVSWLSNTTNGFNALTHRVHESEARDRSRGNQCMLVFRITSKRWVLFQYLAPSAMSSWVRTFHHGLA